MCMANFESTKFRNKLFCAHNMKSMDLQLLTFSSSNSRILCGFRLERFELDNVDPLRVDDDEREWLDDAMTHTLSFDCCLVFFLI